MHELKGLDRTVIMHIIIILWHAKRNRKAEMSH